MVNQLVGVYWDGVVMLMKSNLFYYNYQTVVFVLCSNEKFVSFLTA